MYTDKGCEYVLACGYTGYGHTQSLTQTHIHTHTHNCHTPTHTRTNAHKHMYNANILISYGSMVHGSHILNTHWSYPHSSHILTTHWSYAWSLTSLGLMLRAGTLRTLARLPSASVHASSTNTPTSCDSVLQFSSSSSSSCQSDTHRKFSFTLHCVDSTRLVLATSDTSG